MGHPRNFSVSNRTLSALGEKKKLAKKTSHLIAPISCVMFGEKHVQILSALDKALER